MEATRALMGQIGLEWNHFFYSRTDTGVGGLLRISYAFVAFLNVAHIFRDFDLFYVHLLPVQAGIDSWGTDINSIESVFFYVEEDEETYWLWLGARIWMVQLLLLMVGLMPRFNAIGNFFWHVQFHHHNNILCDGADIMFRLIGFFLMFLPLHRYTIWDCIGWGSSSRPDKSLTDTWPMVSGTQLVSRL